MCMHHGTAHIVIHSLRCYQLAPKSEQIRFRGVQDIALPSEFKQQGLSCWDLELSVTRVVTSLWCIRFQTLNFTHLLHVTRMPQNCEAFFLQNFFECNIVTLCCYQMNTWHCNAVDKCGELGLDPAVWPISMFSLEFSFNGTEIHWIKWIQGIW